jgi:hypothetical protein
LNFWRIASVSGSAKAVFSVLTPFVFALVPLKALSSWAWLISPGGPWEPSLPRGMPKVERTFDPSNLTPTVAGLPGPSVVTLSTTAWAKSWRDLFGPQRGFLVGQTDLFLWLDAFGCGVVGFRRVSSIR